HPAHALHPDGARAGPDRGRRHRRGQRSGGGAPPPGRAARRTRHLQAPDRAREHRLLRPPARPGRSTIRARTEAMAKTLAMDDFLDRRTEGFSQGQRTKTAIARALVHDPRNVILDEPTNGLDVMTTRGLRGFLRELRDEGRCVVFSSHIMQEVAALCDRIVVIAHGEVRAIGTPDELRAMTGLPDLEDVFVRLAGLEGDAA